MSLVGLPVQAVQEALLAKIGQRPIYSIPEGPQQLNFQTTTSTNFDTTLINYTLVPPKGMALGRIFLQNWSVNFTITGTSASGPLLQVGTGFGPRAWPIASSINNITAQLNNGGLTLEYDVLSALFACKAMFDQDDQELSTFPSFPDQFQNYGDWQLYGSARNPLALYGEFSCGRLNSRGGYQGLTILSNPSGSGTLTATCNLDVWEPLVLSPFRQKGLDAAFVGLNQVNVTINVMDLTRMLSIDTSSPLANTITLITPTFAQPPALYNTQLTPKEESPIPKTGMYGYNRINRFKSPMSPLAPGASITVTSPVITLTSIPPAIIVFARRSIGTQSYATSDAFLSLNNLNVIWNGQAGLLSNATQAHLFKIARQNGVNM